jgi:hypothetical protein
MYGHFCSFLCNGKSWAIAFVPVSVPFPQKANKSSDRLNRTWSTSLVYYYQLVQMSLIP